GRQDNAAAAAATGAVIVGRAAGIEWPGVGSRAAEGIGGKAAEPAGLGHHDDAAAGAAPTAAVVEGRHPAAAIGGDGARAAHAAGADHHDPTAVATTARIGGTRVGPRSRPT